MITVTFSFIWARRHDALLNGWRDSLGTTTTLTWLKEGNRRSPAKRVTLNQNPDLRLYPVTFLSSSLRLSSSIFSRATCCCRKLNHVLLDAHPLCLNPNHVLMCKTNKSSTRFNNQKFREWCLSSAHVTHHVGHHVKHRANTSVREWNERWGVCQSLRFAPLRPASQFIDMVTRHHLPNTRASHRSFVSRNYTHFTIKVLRNTKYCFKLKCSEQQTTPQHIIYCWLSCIMCTNSQRL